MKKIIVIIIALTVLIYYIALMAQEKPPVSKDESKKEIKTEENRLGKKDHYFTVQILYPLSTNKTKDDSTWANFSLIYGQIGTVVGLDASYISSFVRHDMTGVQGSGIFAYTGEDLSGVAGSGIATAVKRKC